MVLQMTDICKEYQMGKNVLPVLKHINLTVNENDYIAIMGPSGSGKSTLMNIIGCLDVPTSGTYMLEDNNIGTCNDNRLAELRNKYIGFVFQSFHLMPRMTALDNVTMPLLFAGVKKSERRKRAAEALKIVGLEDRMMHHPDQLSGGQNQRVAIARAIAAKPPMILADEPTGNLDPESGEVVLDALLRLNETGRTVIIITHDPKVASAAKRRIYIDNGMIV